ncbi:uncharacterized protein LOC134740862 [Cydia strobilella]|uniref:uncharacterized protein LOC134740862 n=1 Tax=Cydia strobilella TaxID=1100964 RepID=UPI00300401AD
MRDYWYEKNATYHVIIFSLKLCTEDNGGKNDGNERSPAPRALPVRTISEPLRGTQTPGDTCQVYFREDTPAILSKAGSNSNLSVLSIYSAPPRNAPDTSDSSNLSDADLLEDCIQKGIANNLNNSSSIFPANKSHSGADAKSAFRRGNGRTSGDFLRDTVRDIGPTSRPRPEIDLSA